MDFLIVAGVMGPAVTGAQSVPPTRNEPYPGVIQLEVDLTDIDRRIFSVRETIPVRPGPLTLLYPQWLPGNHAPRGPIEALAGLIVTSDGERLDWQRDPLNVYAFHLKIPPRSRELQLEFQFASPQLRDQGRIVVTPEMLGLQWNTVVLYPAGHAVQHIRVSPSMRLPPEWKYGTSLRETSADGGSVQLETVSLETLVDSPVFAGRYFKRLELDSTRAPVHLNLFADRETELQIAPEQLQAHQKLMREAYALFGSRHFDRYEFLLAISDQFGPVGLEHHRSSENVRLPGYFTQWDKTVAGRGLLPHELVHSWNGKFRRPADLATSNYHDPMRNSLLWVYEGLTEYWEFVLTARSGLWDQDTARQAWAHTAATYEFQRPGRVWRNLQDTVHQPIITARRPQSWTSWQRTEDYYNEGALLWLDVDTQIRELTHEKRSLDDFARAFFGVRDGEVDVVTYTFEDLARALNRVVAYKWSAFLRQRLDSHSRGAPLGGLKKGGWKLVFRDTPSAYLKSNDELRKSLDLGFSIGLVVSLKDKYEISEVIWGSPAFDAGLTKGAKIIAVNGWDFQGPALVQAVKDAKDNGKPIELLVKVLDRYRTFVVDYDGGLRYPDLERTPEGPDRLSAILQGASGT